MSRTISPMLLKASSFPQTVCSFLFQSFLVSYPHFIQHPLVVLEFLEYNIEILLNLCSPGMFHKALLKESEQNIT